MVFWNPTNLEPCQHPNDFRVAFSNQAMNTITQHYPGLDPMLELPQARDFGKLRLLIQLLAQEFTDRHGIGLSMISNTFA